MTTRHNILATVRGDVCLCARKQPQRIRRSGFSLLLCQRCGRFILRIVGK
jgi:hypothetical protein